MYVCPVVVFRGSFVISCISRSWCYSLSSCQGVFELCHKFSRTCRWFITQRMLDKPRVRQVQVFVRGCMHEEWEAGLRSRARCSQGCPLQCWVPPAHGVAQLLLAVGAMMGWLCWLGKAVLLPEGWAPWRALGAGAAGDGLPLNPTAPSELWGRPPGAASIACLAGHVWCLCNYPWNQCTKRLLNAEVFFAITSFSGRERWQKGAGTGITVKISLPSLTMNFCLRFFISVRLFPICKS